MPSTGTTVVHGIRRTPRRPVITATMADGDRSRLRASQPLLLSKPMVASFEDAGPT
jgi:hypothetical protein